MKIKSCKLFKILSCLLFGGVTLVSCVAPLIVSCSSSSNNNQENVDKFWWPKEVLTTDEQIIKYIQDYVCGKYWKENAPKSIKLSEFKNVADRWDDRLSDITFDNFNNIKVYGDLDFQLDWDYDGTIIPNINDLHKENSEKISYITLAIAPSSFSHLTSPNFYFKDTGHKLKAYQTSEESTIPIYEVYVNIKPWILCLQLALYHEDLLDIDPLKFPSSTFTCDCWFDSYDDPGNLPNFHLKFYIAEAQDLENLGGYRGQNSDNWYILNYNISKAIHGFVDNDPYYTSPPNDGNYNW